MHSQPGELFLRANRLRQASETAVNAAEEPLRGHGILARVVEADPRLRVLHVNEGIPESGLFGVRMPIGDSARVPWRLSPEPIPMLPSTIKAVEDLGQPLLDFYRAANRLYLDSVHGTAPMWVARWLQQGKGERELDLAQLRRFKSKLPMVIRPDIMIQADGRLVATELDSVPGGIGLLDSLTARYRELGYEMAGHALGLVPAMARGLIHEAGKQDPSVAIVVSDEAEAYRPEMTWVGERLNQFGVRAVTVHPRQLDLNSGQIVARLEERVEDIDLIYRFFELHDIKNIPNADLIIHAMKKRRVAVTPPMKVHLEEKGLFALFHHPELQPFWEREIESTALDKLRRFIPVTWILDPAEIPAHAAVVPPMITAGRQISRWSNLFDLTQRQRELVLKPSGFSELAWGSRGVTVGHDVNADQWNESLRKALGGFQTTPYVLQHYYNSKSVDVSYYDFEEARVRSFAAKVRVSPYYFVVAGRAEFAGILVTACPASSKILHGMPDAVMAPARPDPDAGI